jgi:glycosyltransferase involved in cell wall biosynthesis
VFGHVRSYKGIDLVLEAMQLLDAEGLTTTLTVAGQFWQPVEPWEHAVADLGLADRVQLRDGYVPDVALDPLFAEHHLVVTPYRTASQSGVVPLAAAAGRPSIVTPVGGLPEQVVDGVDGVVADAVTAAALAGAIARAANDLDRLAEGALAMTTTWEDVGTAVLRAGGVGPTSRP